MSANPVQSRVQKHMLLPSPISHNKMHVLLVSQSDVTNSLLCMNCTVLYCIQFNIFEQLGKTCTCVKMVFVELFHCQFCKVYENLHKGWRCLLTDSFYSLKVNNLLDYLFSYRRLITDSKVKLKYQHLITNSFVEVSCFFSLTIMSL